MKKRDLIKKIKEYGYCFHHHGGDHDAYSNGKRMSEYQDIKKSMKT